MHNLERKSIKGDREEKGRHLYQIQRNDKEDRVGRGNRREEAVLTRLRLE